MKKSIEIIIKQKNLHKPLERIRKVSLGYALNYLIPKQVAEVSTQGKIQHIYMIDRIVSKKKSQIIDNNQRIKSELEKIKKLHIRKKCSLNKQIFGSITENDIINKILTLTGHKLDKKQISIKSIKKISISKCIITLENSYNFSIPLYIVPNII